jgi:pseudouridine-5'-phosphate glycosidase
MIAVINGALRIGMDDPDLERLAEDQFAAKASNADLAWAMSAGKTAGTTVSATLAACAMARHAMPNQIGDRACPGIKVFATGGIGGVHRGWMKSPDISADLRALAATPVCVVSAGAKSILDLPATLEALQMLGVPVIGYRTNWFPQFHSTGEPISAGSSLSRSDCLPLFNRIDDPCAAADLCRTHWTTLGLSTGILLCHPVPREFAVDHLEIDLAIAEAERLAEHRHTTGPKRTPFLLNELARLTEGRSLRANIALLLNNATLAADIAIAMAREKPGAVD